MLRNYLIIAWRNLFRDKGYSFLNISGLAVGMAGAALIFLWIKNEISFDSFHKDKEHIYEVYGLTTMEGKRSTINQTSQPLGQALKQDFPEVVNHARVAGVHSFLLTVNDRAVNKSGGNFVDASFLKLFSFPIISGDLNDPLKNDYSIVITESLAKKLFGNQEALHQKIKIDSSDLFVVTAVLKDLPANTRFDFDYLLPWSYLKKLGWNDDSWLSNNISTFIQLNPAADLNAFNGKIKDITRKYSGKPDLWTHFLFPLNQWHLYSKFVNGRPAGGRIETVRWFGLIAVFILFIACINFTNLSTARSEKRAKEVGLRKMAGAGKSLLVIQFIAESILTAFIAGLVALIMVILSLPAFGAMIDATLVIPYRLPVFWITAIGFILLTGLLAGSYPAFSLASFTPTSIFQRKFKSVSGLINPRKVLVVLQFTFAVILIISVIIVQKQIQYGLDRNVGYSAQNLIHVDFAGDIEKNYPLIKDELLRQGVASSVTKTMTTITRKGSNTWGLKWKGKAPDFDEAIGLFSTDADLVKTTGLKLISGRDIDIHAYPTDSQAVLLNETAAKLMGFDHPIGEIIQQPSANINWHVVGVVEDYVINSPYGKVPPMVIEGPKSWFTTMHIRFNESLPTSECLDKAEEVFKKYNTAYPFDYQFVDQEYANQFKQEQQTRQLAGLFALLAIIISCLGLLGLASYSTLQRRKEIGIRKVVGASVFSIIHLLSWDFIKLVMIAIFISIPLAWYGANQWLNNFEYQVDLTFGIFGLAGVIAVVIALITVSFHAIKAAWMNPVESIKN